MLLMAVNKIANTTIKGIGKGLADLELYIRKNQQGLNIVRLDLAKVPSSHFSGDALMGWLAIVD